MSNTNPFHSDSPSSFHLIFHVFFLQFSMIHLNPRPQIVASIFFSIPPFWKACLLRSGALGDHANNRCAAGILRVVEWWQRLQEPERHGCLYRIQASRFLRDFSTLVILANAVSITLLTVAWPNSRACVHPVHVQRDQASHKM